MPVMEDQTPPNTLEPIFSTVWMVGDWKHAEFGEVVAWLKGRTTFVLFEDADAVLSSGRADGRHVPTAIVLAQSRPGQISRRDVDRLYASAPLARLVEVAGTWCEGELRGAPSWPGVIRVPLCTWRCRLEEALGLDGVGARPPVPRTMTAAERIELALATLVRDRNRTARAAVYSACRENHEAIADMLRQLGVESVSSSGADADVGVIDVMVFDGWELVSAHGGSPRKERGVNSPPRMLLMHFPRDGDYARAIEEGIDIVLKLPALLSDMATSLEQILRPAGGPLACAAGL